MMTRIEAAAMKAIEERGGRIHFQLSPGGLRVLLGLERRGLVVACADGYHFRAA